MESEGDVGKDGTRERGGGRVERKWERETRDREGKRVEYREMEDRGTWKARVAMRKEQGFVRRLSAGGAVHLRPAVVT